ncbi:hypothetical protein ACHAPI_011079 [Fusarium lateritium]
MKQKPNHTRAVFRALKGDKNKLSITFQEREHKTPLGGKKFQPVTWEAVHLYFGATDELIGVDVRNSIPLGIIRPEKGKPGHRFRPIAYDNYSAINKDPRRDAATLDLKASLHGDELRVGAVNRLSSPEVWPSLMKDDPLVFRKQAIFNELLIGKGLWDLHSEGLQVDLPSFDLFQDVPVKLQDACFDQIFEDDKERVRQYFGRLHMGLGLVSGPPGTGKSHLASILVMVMCFNHSIKHVYVSAASNGSTDNILERIDNIATKTTKRMIEDGSEIKHLMLVRGYSLNEEVENCSRGLFGSLFLEDNVWSPSSWRFERSLCWWTLRALGWKDVPPLTIDDNAELWELHEKLNVLSESPNTGDPDLSKFQYLVQVAQGINCVDEYKKAVRTRDTHQKTLRQLMKLVVHCANVVATTPVMSSNWLYESFNSTKARAVVFDEAATMFCADGLLVYGNTPRPMIAIGDPKQLAPVLSTAMEKLYTGTKSYYDRELGKRVTRRRDEGPPVNRFADFAKISWLSWFIHLGWPVFHLYTQHRMAEGLFDVSLNTVYKSLKPNFKYSTLCRLENFPIGVDVEDYLKKKHRISAPLDGTIQPVFFNCANSPCRQYPDNPSRLNPRQADLIATVLMGMIKELALFPADIAVLTPYRANLRALGKRFRKEESLRDIVCSTFDGFQGREAQIVVLALCVTEETGPAHVAAERSLNVAMTRQRSSLLIFGDIATTAKMPWSPRSEDDWIDERASTEFTKQKVFREVFRMIRQSGRIVQLVGNPAADPDSYWLRLAKSTQIL